MKLDSGLNRIKECYLFAHLTYCILSVSCLMELLRSSQLSFNEEYFHYLWVVCMFIIIALIPAQHKIITKTFYRDHRHLHLYKLLYTTAICLVYTPIITSILAGKSLSILVIVPVILNSIICGTVYGLVTSLVVLLVALLVCINHSGFSNQLLTEYLLTLALMATTAWFTGQSFEYIKNLFYQLVESDKNQKSILDNLGVATLHVDGSGYIIHANKRFRDLFGYQPEEQAMLNDIIERHLPFLKPAATGKGKLLISCSPVFGQAVDGRGKSMPVQCVIHQVSTGMGNDNGLVLCINDLSLSEKLEEERARTNYFIDFINSGVILADGSGKIIELNRQAEALLHLDKQSVLNENLQCLLGRLAGKKPDQQATSSYEVEMAGRTLLFNRADLRTRSGKIVGMACIVNDITDRKEMERKLQRSATLSAIGELAAGTAHEIRNPLTSIRGFLQLMKEKKDAPIRDFDGYFDIILAEADRINAIITEFLKLAKQEKVELRPVNLNDIINFIWGLLNSEALLREIHLVRKLDPEAPPIMGNIDMLKQVVINLVNNALQATGRGGVVKVVTRRKENGVLLIVEDNGVGIEESILPRIFDPFFTTRDEGTGLGLAITNKILGEHNASINVTSKPGRGTTFYITFPLAEKTENTDTH
jgi:PAS domain S-box-containing protein